MAVALYIALFGWPVAVLAMFSFMSARRVVIIAFVGGWLFLPMASFPLPGFPDYSKVSATIMAALLGCVVFDARQFSRLQARWYDIPMVMWCIAPLLSSLSNGLGVYDGVSCMVQHLILWACPYLLGRAYFGDGEAVRDLVMGVVVGAIVYIPLCWIEIRFSPQLHAWVYGFHQHSFAQTRRSGGFRPTVFLQHGLAVGLWMAVGTVIAFWLGITRSVPRIWRVPMGAWAMLLAITAVACKSFGSLALLAATAGALCEGKWGKRGVVMFVLACVPSGYAAARVSQLWDGRAVVSLIESSAGRERAGSLRVRLESEDLLIARALEQPVFGWGGWNRSQPPAAKERVITDGFWIITLGHNGLFGLSSVIVLFALPTWALLWTIDPRRWHLPAVSAYPALAACSAMCGIDNLFNAMVNPVFILSIGASMSVLDMGLAGSPTFSTGTVRPPEAS